VFDGPGAAGPVVPGVKRFKIVMALLGLTLGRPSPALACACVGGWPTVESTAASAEAALIGRVLARLTREGLAAEPGQAVAALDVEVVQTIKGVKKGRSLRVWDPMTGTSCSDGLGEFATNTLVAMALSKATSVEREFYEVLKLPIKPGTYLVGSCGEYVRAVPSPKDGADLVERVKRLRRVRK